MVKIKKYTLDNGLNILVHKDKSTPIATVNLLYNIGSKHEEPHRTGFAHLFEHLMFEGSLNIPNYDTPLQKAGGENNAFTSNDITNYYLTLPIQNLETALWLESDRMLGLNLTQEKLDIQKNVVIEEYNQRYINQPYGDAMLILRSLAYKNHPYKWPTIGKDISHIQNATLDEVEHFFYHHYAPNNAILTIAGNIEPENVYELAKKWFAPIPEREINREEIPQEPKQKAPRTEKVQRDVPHNVLYKAYHMVSRNHPDFPASDLISDILSNGKSARLYQQLVKENPIFSNIDAYITGDTEPGLFLINGAVSEGVAMEEAEAALNNELAKLTNETVEEEELQKVKNKFEAVHEFSKTSALHKAMNMSFFELLGDAERINTEINKYRAVTPTDIKRVSKEILDENNCSTLYYHKK